MTLDTEKEARRQAIAYLQQKRKLVADLAGYVSVNGVLWLIWALTGHSAGGTMPWPAWVSAIWGFLLAMDAVKLWTRAHNRPITEAEIEREIHRSASIFR
jgi:2TM domain